MNFHSPRKLSDINELIINLLHKVFQRPDFYPIKYYHRKRKDRTELGEL